MPRGKPQEFTHLQRDVIEAAIELGWSKRRTAEYLGIPESNLRRYLAKIPPLLENPEDVEIVTPIHLTPSSPPTPIRDGDAAYCVVSHLTGIENHAKLQKPRPKKPEKSKAKFQPKRPRKKVTA